MLDDIRNSTLLIMVCAVVMAVVTIALSPEPHGNAKASRKPATAAVAKVANTVKPADAAACKPDPVLELAASR